MNKPDMIILSFTLYVLIIFSIFAFVEERECLAIRSPSSGDEGKAFLIVNEGESQSENFLYDNEPTYGGQNTDVPASGLIDPENGKNVPGPSYIISLAVFGLAYCLKIRKQ